MTVTRRAALASLACAFSQAAGRLPANRNVRWALGANLWNYFPRVPFTDILDVMRDTGFIGIRLTQFPQILTTYDITQAQMEKEVARRGSATSSRSRSTLRRTMPHGVPQIMADARTAMNFLREFGADRLVVFSPIALGWSQRRALPHHVRVLQPTGRGSRRDGRSAPACTTTWASWCRPKKKWTAACP